MFNLVEKYFVCMYVSFELVSTFNVMLTDMYIKKLCNA